MFSNSHERPSRHHERRWRGGSSSSRWPYSQKPNDSASSSSVPRAVATTVAGTTIVVGATGAAIPGTSTPLLPVRGHEACLLPCHGPCAASNQASSCCKGFAGAANNGHHHHPPTPSSPESGPHHREPHLILARKHLRVRTVFHPLPVLMLLSFSRTHPRTCASSTNIRSLSLFFRCCDDRKH